MAERRRKAAPAPLPEVEGRIERADPDGTVVGYCWSPRDAASRRTVVVTVNGHAAARAACEAARPDLAELGKGDGLCGFSVRLPPSVRPEGEHALLGLRDTATGHLLGDEVAVVWGSATPLSGNVDKITRDGWVTGWCWDPARPAHRVVLEILVDDMVAGTTTAASFRADLPEAGIGDGGHAFSYALPFEILARKGALTVSVREAGTGRPLGTPATLRIGRLAEAETRARELERTVRLLNGRVAELERAAAGRRATEEQETRALFATIAAFFRELAEGVPPEARGFGLGAGVAPTLASLAAALPPFSLRSPPSPEALIVVLATGPVEAVHRCLSALRQADVDAQADIVVLDPGDADERCTLLPGLISGLRYSHVEAGSLVAEFDERVHATALPFVGLVSPDIDVDPTWLPALLATFAEEPDAALIGAPAVRADALLQHGGFGIETDGSISDPLALTDIDSAEAAVLRPVHAIAGLAWLGRREALIRAGGFDNAYTALGPALVDLCLRLRPGAVLVQPAARALWVGAPDADPVTPDLSACDADAVRLRRAVAERTPGPSFIGRVLVIDDAIPRPDRDGGSVAALAHMLILRRLGWHVTFCPAGNTAPSGDRAALECRGIVVRDAPADLLREQGEIFDLVQIYRYGNARLLGPVVRAFAPAARLLFSPADLHFLRAEREAKLAGRRRDASLTAARAEELACIREADATLVYSDHEQTLLAREMPDAPVYLLRWIVRPEPPRAGFTERFGLLFVGGFSHAPNVDAILWFVESVMPVLRRDRPGLVLHVVGAEAPYSVEALAAPDVIVHGWVPDLASMLEQVRLTVAPLRAGAGFKGKVAGSLSHGVPVVGTAIAFEGTGLRDGDGIARADDETEFAEAIVRIHDNEATWRTASERALERVAALYSPQHAEDVYRSLLADLGCPYDRDDGPSAPAAPPGR